MTTRTLVDALRGDMHVKFAIIRSLADIKGAFDGLSAGIDALRQSIESQPGTAADSDATRRVLADILAVDALAKELAGHIDEHQLALDNGMFGAGAHRPA